MSSFGEKLRRERESHDMAIEEISTATGIGLSYLEALERNEFESLPGRAFGKLYIRAYAEVLKFDPRPLLADYDREQQARKMNEPPGGHPTKPIMVRPEMPAQPPQAEPVEDEPDETPHEEIPAEALQDEPDDLPHAMPIEDAPTEEADEAPSEVLQEETAEVPVPEPTGSPVEEPTLKEPEPPQEMKPASSAHVEPPRRSDVRAAAFTELLRTPEERPDRRRFALVAALIGIPLLIAIVWVLFGVLGGDHEETEPAASSAATLDDLTNTATPSTSAAPPPAPSGDPATPEAQPEATDRPAEPAAETDAEPSPIDAGADHGGLVVDEFGVGRKVVNHRLVDRDDQFREGEVVWFLTRVLGGRRGERIRHVWLHEGAAVQSIDLVIGGSHWRTQSNKTLWGLGSWTVEVRDREDRVLARAAFTCVSR